MKELLKKMIFMTIEDQVSLKDFESWLYSQNELSDQMGDDLILEVFTFNYNQKGATNLFKDIILPYFDKDDFMLWKIKANLQDLIDGKNDRNIILYDFIDLGYDGFPFLSSIGYYAYSLEDLQYSTQSESEIVQELKKDSSQLLIEIERQERDNSKFKITQLSSQI